MEELVDAGVLRQRSVGTEELYELADRDFKTFWLKTCHLESSPPPRAARRRNGEALPTSAHGGVGTAGPAFELGHIPAKPTPTRFVQGSD